MKILKITELRNWAKEQGYSDSWYYRVEGIGSVQPSKIAKVPREGDVDVRNADSPNNEENSWFRFRYPGYETPEEIVEKIEAERRRNQPSPKQTVALEFFGYATEGVDRDKASDILDKCFSSDYDLEEYQEFKWKNRKRIYDETELYQELLKRGQNKTFHLRENISYEKMREVITEAKKQCIIDTEFYAFIGRTFPELLLADSTRKRKLREYKELHGYNHVVFDTTGSKSGCLGVVVLGFIASGILGYAFSRIV